MTNALNRGEVQIILAGETRTLKPSLEAFQRIGALAGAGLNVWNAALAGNLTVMITALRYGLGMTDEEAKKLPAMIYETGISPLRFKLYDFVFLLLHGGKTPQEVEAEMAAMEDDAGKEVVAA
jgi:hypothetical protein